MGAAPTFQLEDMPVEELRQIVTKNDFNNKQKRGGAAWEHRSNADIASSDEEEDATFPPNGSAKAVNGVRAKRSLPEPSLRGTLQIAARTADTSIDTMPPSNSLADMARRFVDRRAKRQRVSVGGVV